jgi:heptosyltransferase-2
MTSDKGTGAIAGPMRSAPLESTLTHAPRGGNDAPAHDGVLGRAEARLVIVAPNWLGDAVMALPAIDDVARARPGWAIAVAARPSIAPLFSMVPAVSEVVTLPAASGAWRQAAVQLEARSFDAALVLPNSFQSALAVWKAGIAERWGYRRECRGVLLTRAMKRPSGGHQAEYYQKLTTGLGFDSGPLEPRLRATDRTVSAGGRLLAEAGWDGRAPIVAIAPGAAYGGAKRWPVQSFAELTKRLNAEGVAVVVIGSAADRQTGAAVESAAGPSARAINLVGRTDLPALAGVLAQCRGLVSNDSGAMHVGAALGIPVTAIFGPTDERATRPLGPKPPVVLTSPVWCRPCMLRECPIDHRCMRRIGVDTVLAAARQAL